MADDIRAVVQRMIDAGESEENIATVIQHASQQPKIEASPSRTKVMGWLNQADARGAELRHNAADNPARTGALIGAGFAGGGVVPSLLMGAAGAGTGMLLRRFADPKSQPLSVPESLKTMGTEGAIQGGFAGAGRLVSRGGRSLYGWGVGMLPKTLKQEFPNLAQAGFGEGIPLTRGGAAKAEQLGRASADQADAVITARQAQRPRVAGLLPEGQVAVPLGETPQPTGATPSLQQAAEIQPRHVGAVGNAEEILGRSWSPAYGGTPTGEATGDVVAGAGTVRRPMNAPAVDGPVPGMVSFGDATTHVPGVTGALESRALGANEPSLRRIAGFMQATRTGRQWPASLTSAQALKRAEQEIAHNAYRAMDRGAVTQVSPRAQFAQAVARGTREAIEREVPAVAPINQRTQDLMGLQRAAEHSAETAHIFPRFMAAGGAGLAAGGAGLATHGGALMPALLPALGAAAGAGALATPAGLTSLGLGAKAAGKATPQMLRAALLALMASHQPEQQ